MNDLPMRLRKKEQENGGAAAHRQSLFISPTPVNNFRQFFVTMTIFETFIAWTEVRRKSIALRAGDFFGT